MLDELLKYNNLGTKRELTFVLFSVLNRDQEIRVSDFITFCTSNVFSINRSIPGILLLLQYLGIIKVENNKIERQVNFNPQFFIKPDYYFDNGQFFFSLINRLMEEPDNTLFSTANVKFDSTQGNYYIKPNLIPLKYTGVKNLLISTGFFAYNHDNIDKLVIPKKFAIFFEELVLSKLENQSQKPSLTDAQLMNILKRKKEAGKEGELFVLEYEKRRLLSHPLLNKIKRISEDNVNAGYDIQSFHNIDSLFIDRYIEVKSYTGEIEFYWSKNEILQAQNMNSRYFLYLVDRDAINDANYIPKILQDPYKKIFENEFWKKEIENWRITLETT